MPRRQTIYLVDNEPAARRSLERLLQSAGYDVLSFESATTFLAVAPSLGFGCVLLEVGMPELSGFDVLERLRQSGVALGVVMMAADGDVRTAVSAMKAGAADFIEKPFEHNTLVAALEEALAGVPAGSNSGEAKDATRRIAQLTPRESEVLAALAAGMTTKTIAFELGISVRTVEAHRGRMLERLGTKRLAEAIKLAVLASFS